MSVTTTSSFTITVTVNPAIASLGLSSVALTSGPVNAGTVIGAVSVVQNPTTAPAYTGVITLGGTNAADFALTNGGVLPCNLVVGAANLPAGAYNVTLSGTE